MIDLQNESRGMENQKLQLMHEIGLYDFLKSLRILSVDKTNMYVCWYLCINP